MSRTKTPKKVQPLSGYDCSQHIAWATAIAKRVARSYKLLPHSQEEEDVVSTVLTKMCELAQRYDPSREEYATDCDALFKGFVGLSLQTEARRECRRLFNGGMYNTRQETKGVSLIVDHFGDKHEDDNPWEPADTKVERHEYM